MLRPGVISEVSHEIRFAKPLYEKFSALLANEGVPVANGIFAADMQVELINDGPVTLMLESPSPQ